MTLWGMADAPGASAELALVAAAWRRAGIGVTVRQVPAAEIFGQRGPLLSPDRFRSATMDAVLYTWTNAPDPDDTAYWQSGEVASPQHPDGTNFVGYRSPVVDHLLAAAQGEANLQVRTGLYQRIQLVLTRDQPAIFIAWPFTLSAGPSQLHGYLPNPYLPAVAWNAAEWSLSGS